MARKHSAIAQLNQFSLPYIEWLRLHEDPPPTLYHYTTADALIPILQSGHLWATNSRFMNDPTELSYAILLLRQVLEEESKRPKSTTLKQVITSLKDVLKEQEANARVYLACFCTDRDLLSQWRAYGAFGVGYALGFDSSSLYGDDVYERPPFRVLRKVIYNVELQRKVIREWLVAFAQRAAPKQRNQLWGDFWQFFSECLSTFKNQAYAEEGEWRLIQFGRHPAGAWEWPMKFRARNGQVVPYADIDLTKSSGAHHGQVPVRTIIHGPTLEPERTMRSLRLFCVSCGFDLANFDLVASTIPFVG